MFKYIPDMTVLYTQFRTGEIDHTSIQGIHPDHYAEAKTLRDRVIAVTPSPSIESITPNFGTPCLADHAVREALYLGMNKQPIIDAIYYGLPTPSESFLPRQNWAYNSNLPKHDYNPAKANQILDAAGWVRGSDGVRAKGGVRLAFSNSTTAGNHVREQTQQTADAGLEGDRRRDDDQEHAGRRRLGRLLRHVQVPDGDGRHRLRHWSRPRRHRSLRHHRNSGQGRRRQQHHAVRQPEGGQVCCARARRIRPWPSAARYTSRSSSQIRADLALLPMFQCTPPSRAPRQGLIGYDAEHQRAVQLLELRRLVLDELRAAVTTSGRAEAAWPPI